MQVPESTLTRALLRWWPSRRLHNDPLADLVIEDRYAPVTIANWKLTPWARRTVLERRHPVRIEFETCRRLTIVIPFRDRERHLAQLLPELLPVLERQQVRARILVVEQQNTGLFNRGKLINIGIHFAAAESDYYCLHDVDAIPVEANYQCPSQPLRLVNSILIGDVVSKRPAHYFSGAISIRKEQVFEANGYSNEYWGWSKEDDDFFFRLLLTGFVSFFDMRGVFKDLPNPQHQQVTRKRFKTPPHVYANRARRSDLLRGLTDPSRDGLGNLAYEVLEHESHAEYERIKVRW